MVLLLRRTQTSCCTATKNCGGTRNKMSGISYTSGALFDQRSLIKQAAEACRYPTETAEPDWLILVRACRAPHPKEEKHA
jgi:hypothetical protein